VAFHADFVGNGVARAREFISKANCGSTAPVEAHMGEFDQVLSPPNRRSANIRAFAEFMLDTMNAADGEP
jgi:hypothetical protein